MKISNIETPTTAPGGALWTPRRRWRVLFIRNRRHSYWGPAEHLATDLSSGLGNSVSFLVDMLAGLGVAAKAVEVADNNAIDHEVASFAATHAIVEALWVVPEKFDVLSRLHPRVQWIVRTHSQAPFLAGEGIATAWIAGYLRRGVEIMCNSAEAQAEIKAMATDFGHSGSLVSLGPNFYPIPGQSAVRPHRPVANGEVHIGCFGAIRPLKNHLAQAIAAISFANLAGLKLRFHINSGRLEGDASPILRNLRGLFAASAGARHLLVEHGWMPHTEFLATLAAATDIAMQASFSETFNIVSADSASVGLPVIASPSIQWIGSYAQVAAGDVVGMEQALHAVWGVDLHRRLAQQGNDLTAWSMASRAIWSARFL